MLTLPTCAEGQPGPARGRQRPVTWAFSMRGANLSPQGPPSQWRHKVCRVTRPGQSTWPVSARHPWFFPGDSPPVLPGHTAGYVPSPREERVLPASGCGQLSGLGAGL